MLAAIGEIESGDGANNGPSSAGALGPMQFLPSTWRIWGTDGFGRAGPPDIMNPLDAVPAAARMLCADGAASGGAALSGGDLRLQPRRLVRARGARAGRRVRAGIPVNGGKKMVPMRLRTGRALAACLIGAGCAAWGLAGGLPGTALAAAGSQCEALPAGSSASASASQAELCVSVQASQSGIKRGQAASFTVQVSVQNGSASGVSVTLAASPQGQAATFTGRCPGGNGSATCAIGSLGTSLAPAAYSLQAQIPVASSASSVTSVTLTATADAATSPAMAAMPSASQSVSVAAASASRRHRRPRRRRRRARLRWRRSARSVPRRWPRCCRRSPSRPRRA